ncbi:hypothetical protein AB0O99_04135 [Cellulosimicrobium funkei]|uniref:hypothetical protein n=1 Tax=Cellulosimicrobium funkei TaxID=264251 RepID=UPI00341F2A0D
MTRTHTKKSGTPEYYKRWRLDSSRGIRRLVDADPVHAHLARLVAAGWSYRAISEAAGVAPTTVHKITHRGQATVRRDVAARILRVRADQVLARRANPAGFVPAVGARRRIEALLALGWRHEDITMASGLPGPGRSGVVLHQRGDWLAKATHDAILTAYAALSSRPGPSDRTRRRALALGYAPPAAWDDDAALDDPDAAPAAGWRPDRAHRTGADLDEFERLTAAGEDPGRAARRLGVTTSAIAKAARRNGRPDLAAVADTHRQRERTQQRADERNAA